MSYIRVQDGTARDALRYHAVGLVRAGLPKVGTFHRHQTVCCDLCSWHCSWRGLHHVWHSIACQTCSQAGIFDVMVPDDRNCVVKGHCGVCGLQGRPGSGSPTAQCLNVAPVAPVVIAKKRAEVAKARPGENAPQATITCIEAAMRSSSYANGVMVEQRAKFQVCDS